MAKKDTIKNVLAGAAVVGIIAGGTLGIAKLVDDNKKAEKPETETAQVVNVELAGVPELGI